MKLEDYANRLSMLKAGLMATNPGGQIINYLTPPKSNSSGDLSLPPIIRDYAPIDDELAWDYRNDPKYFAHPAFGPAKGSSVATLGSGALNKVSDNIFLDRLATIPQTAVVGLGELAYQLGTDWREPKKALADAFEQTAGYGISRWRGDDLNTTDDMWKAGIKSEQTLENFKNIFKGNIEVNPYDITALGGPRAKGNIFNPVPEVQPTTPVTQPITTNEPTITPPPARAVIPNQTKFGPTRSTAIRGGRGGRGNVGARKKTQSAAPVFKSYGPPNRQRY